MVQPGAVPERLAAVAATWTSLAANAVPSLPMAPVVAESVEAHVLATVCVEVVQPLTGVAARWEDGASTSLLGRVEVKLRHLEATATKAGRDLGLGPAIADTRALLTDLGVRSTAPRREAGAPSAWFQVTVDEEEALIGRQVLLALASALRQGASGPTRRAGPADYRFRDAPAVLAFWSMKVETCSPGVTQKLALRLARRSPHAAIAAAATELLERMRTEPSDVATSDRYVDLVTLCERTLADTTAPR